MLYQSIVFEMDGPGLDVKVELVCRRGVGENRAFLVSNWLHILFCSQNPFPIDSFIYRSKQVPEYGGGRTIKMLR